MKKYKTLINTALSILICIVGISNIVIVANTLYKLHERENRVQKLHETYDYITDIISEIRTYTDDYQLENNTDYDKAMENAIQSYVLSMDDKYAYYQSPEDYETSQNQTKGNNVGIGIRASFNSEKGVYIDRIMENSAAETYELQRGDYIVEIENQKVIEIGFNKFLEISRGNVGDTRNIVIDRNGKLINKEIILSDYKSNSMDIDIVNEDTAIVRINEFSSVLKDAFNNKMMELRKSGIPNFVIDLRNNTGGELQTAVSMIDFMVGEGLIVEIKDKNGEVTEQYYSDRFRFTSNIVIVVNELSASASELFTQSMRDYDRAKIVGTQTYGKGTVLTVMPLSNGGAVVFSTGLYTTKSGTFLEGNGIIPDYIVELTEYEQAHLYELGIENDPQIQKALEVLEENKKK